jgi:hypothetical protein
MPIVVVGVTGASAVAAGDATGDAAGVAAGEAIVSGVATTFTGVDTAIDAAVGLAAGDGLVAAVCVATGVAVVVGSANVGMSVGTMSPGSGDAVPSEVFPAGGVHRAIGTLDPPASDPTAAPRPTAAMIASTMMIRRVLATVDPHATRAKATFAC